MSMTECIEWIQSKDGFRYMHAESTKTTTLSSKDIEKTNRRNKVYLRRMTRKHWKQFSQMDDQISNMARPKMEVLSLCEIQAPPMRQSSYVDAAVLRLRGGGDTVDTSTDDPVNAQKQSSTSTSPPPLCQLFNPTYFAGRRVAEAKRYATLISKANSSLSHNYGTVQAQQDDVDDDVWYIKFDNTTSRTSTQKWDQNQVINGIGLYNTCTGVADQVDAGLFVPGSATEVAEVNDESGSMDLNEVQCQIAIAALCDTVSPVPTATEQQVGRVQRALIADPVEGSARTPRVIRTTPLLPNPGVNRTVPVVTVPSTNGSTSPATNKQAYPTTKILGKTSVFSVIKDYQHSVYAYPPLSPLQDTQNKFLLPSVDGIINLAAELNLKLLPDVVASLKKSGGRFCQFTSISDPLSGAARAYLESNSESTQQFNEQNNNENLGRQQRVNVSGSLRFGDQLGVLAANESEDLLRKLYTFCAIKGDYESMMIMLETPPTHSPPIDPITIRQFVHHRMAPPGTPLFVDFATEITPLVDIFGNHIHSQGACQSVNAMNHTFSPIRTLHEKHQQVGPHHDFCPDCRPLLIEHTKSKSTCVIPKCQYHHQQGSGNAASLFFASGDSVDSKQVNLAKADIRKFAKATGNRPVQRDAFLPPEMLAIHELVAARKFTKHDFMFLLMFIQSYTLANRATGLINSRMFDFNDSMWASVNSLKHGIQSFPKTVFEKNEKVRSVYNVEWRDDYPKLCWLRHLFIYVHCHRYEANMEPTPPDGYKVDDDGLPILPPHDLNKEKLFPVPLSAKIKKQMEDSPIVFLDSDSPADTALHKTKLTAREHQIEESGKQQYLTWLKKMYKGSCHPVPGATPINIGTHSGRMTFYMCGILGGGDPDRVRECARHQRGDVSDKYAGDACTFYETMLENPALRKNLAIYPFKSNLCRGSKGTHERVYEHMDHLPIPNMDSIQKAATYFVEQMLHVEPTDKNYRNADFLLRKSYQKRFTEESRSCTEQMILDLPIKASERLAIFRSIDRDYEASGVAPRYKYNNTNEIPTNISSIPKTAVLSVTSMTNLISANVQQPVNQFLLIEFHKLNKSCTIDYRLKDDDGMRINLFKLTGIHLVYATFRLYHEVASLAVHQFNPDRNDWSYNTCSDFNLADNISKITRLRHHRKHNPQLRYFATCLTNCHNSDPDKFHAAHPNWVFRANKAEQKVVCPCKSAKCAAVWTPAATSSKRKAVTAVSPDVSAASSKKNKESDRS
jgi:hypothetical protein